MKPILKMRMKSLFCDNYVIISYWLKEKDKKIYVFEVIIFFFFENVQLQSISKNSLQTSSLEILHCEIKLF